LVEIKEKEAIVQMISAEGKDLASPLGYRPIRESILLASAKTLENGLVIGLRTGLEALRAAQRRDPKSIQFMRNRAGELALFKPALPGV